MCFMLHDWIMLRTISNITTYGLINFKLVFRSMHRIHITPFKKRMIKLASIRTTMPISIPTCDSFKGTFVEQTKGHQKEKASKGKGNFQDLKAKEITELLFTYSALSRVLDFLLQGAV